MIRKLLILIFIAVCLLIHTPAFAQCCTKPPNLLASYNCDFSAPFTAVPSGFMTDDTYSSSPAGCGYYYIVNQRNWGACSQLPQFDHTRGDTAGRFLWYDTPCSADLNYPGTAWMPYDPKQPAGRENLITVKKNTNYVFSAWVRDLARYDNCASGGAPLAGLTINGSSIAEIDLDLVSSSCCPEWKQVCGVWNSGDETAALIKIESKRGSGFSDLGIDDVYFGAEPEAEVLNLGNDTVLCESEQLILYANADSNSYLWSTGDTAAFIIADTGGDYWVKETSSCKELSDTISITVLPKKNLELGNNIISCAKAEPVILKSNTDFERYIWSTGDTAQEITVNKTGSYYLHAADECNDETDSITVVFEDCYCEFFVPNAFTPDGDGLNDVFTPACSCELKKYSLQLFDRWGKLVYITSDINDSWDGTVSGSAAEQGIYTVKIIYQPEDFYVNSEKIIYSSLMVLK